MRKTLHTTFLLVATGLAVACAGSSTPESNVNGNVLLAEWTGPYDGVPAFDAMDLAALEPALEKGMALQLAEIDAIAGNPDPPTFENTIVTMEHAGRPSGPPDYFRAPG